jgi:hypothetical protein
MKRSARLISRPAPARRWITALALLAFVFQSLTVQTHVHQPLQPGPVKAAHLSASGGSQAPLKLDPVDQCRLCQELVHAGTFLAPSAVISPLSLSFATVSIARVLAFATDPATAFAWQSRAPPRG